MKTLKTQRLVLRGWRLADLDDFFTYAQNPAVGPAAGWPPHTDKAESAVILNDFIAKEEVWAMQLRSGGRVIGSVGLHPDKKRTGVAARMLGYVLDEPYWGQGLMPEAVHCVLKHAFGPMGLQVVAVNHYPFNARSRRVIEKCGFTYEGTLRRSYERYDGQVFDEVCYSMLKEEFKP